MPHSYFDEGLIAKRKSGHDAFDRIWANAQNPQLVRDIAYKWLADKLGVSRHRAHFSRLRGTKLREAIKFARQANAGIVVHWWQTKGRFLQPGNNKPTKSQMNTSPPRSYHPPKALEQSNRPGNDIQYREALPAVRRVDRIDPQLGIASPAA